MTDDPDRCLRFAIRDVANAEATAFMGGCEGAVIAAMESAIGRLRQSILDRLAAMPIPPDPDDEAV